MKAIFTILLLPGMSHVLVAGDNNYVGAVGGFAILSADASSRIESENAAVSQYKPKTGPALNIFVGRHFSDYLSGQLNYVWNKNDVRFTGVEFNADPGSAFQERRTSSQQSFTADVLVYFRARRSWIRPYLSAGIGVVHLQSEQRALESFSGDIPLPPLSFSDTVPGLRVAVGADLRLGRGWSFRYSFSETVSANPLSDRLSPPGEGSLKNFHNLFGVVKAF